MSVLQHPDFDAHEHVSFFCDPQGGLRAITAIHRSVMGGAGGGCRMWPYAHEDDAVRDVLRLSRAMTYKLALADLPAGGAKTVVLGDPNRDKSPALFRALGRAVERLGGRYIIAQDVGTTAEDMALVAEETQYVVGTNQDTSAATAYGVFVGLKAAVQRRLGRELAGMTVAIQGLGGVGYRLAQHLHQARAKLVVADLDNDRCHRAHQELGAQVVSTDAIAASPAEVFAPCALGSVLNGELVAKLRCQVVAGGANNQLAHDDCADELADRHILYAPDFVINVGGVIGAAHGLASMIGDEPPADALQQKLSVVGDLLTTVFDRAARDNVSTQAAAVSLAKEKLAEW